MLRLEVRLYGHWGIPLLSRFIVHSLDNDWFLVQWLGILMCVYTGLLNMLQVRYLITVHFTFCLSAEAFKPVSVVYSARSSCDFYIQHKSHYTRDFLKVNYSVSFLWNCNRYKRIAIMDRMICLYKNIFYYHHY